MKPVQRQWDKLLKKGPNEDARVSSVLQDFDDADHSLGQLIEAAKTWRDSWVSILTLQAAIANEFDVLYKPIPGPPDGRQDYAEASHEQVERALKFKEAYAELKQDLLDEVGAIDSRMIAPALEARENLQPLKKTIKKRENKHLDMQRYQDKVDSLMKKSQRSDRESVTLAKTEHELSMATDEFQRYDDQVRETVPPTITAVRALIPKLLAGQIVTQTTLLAQYYTVLHNYCQDFGFPSPPPPMNQVFTTWQTSFQPVQREAEGLQILVRGKAAQQSMSTGSNEESQARPTSSLRPNLSVFGGSSNRQDSTASNTNGNQNSRLRIPSFGAANSSTQRTPAHSHDQAPEIPPHPTNYPAQTPSSSYSNSSYNRPVSAHSQNTLSPHNGAGADYFARPTSASSSLSPSAAAAAKKKPPPPPPKRKPSHQQLHYVTALYSFAGEGAGDLSFKEGDQIRVVKKTESTDDWWTGELNGKTGSFPANYCK